jgi:hypothetical protein
MEEWETHTAENLSGIRIEIFIHRVVNVICKRHRTFKTRLTNISILMLHRIQMMTSVSVIHLNVAEVLLNFFYEIRDRREQEWRLLDRALPKSDTHRCEFAGLVGRIGALLLTYPFF